ncbi:Subtilisin NAT precursor [Stieleria neptunia]|uniref:Subtilisin NAT n=1 Tax=Stieleria neptunia TaxID=2527979 RepID=A0A518HJ20_9BACT|nr:S8 family serine peptidase [Stieleria neptunia]QDV40832.1 Subtilisin NAT precursor [Stieleria neptunia]
MGISYPKSNSNEKRCRSLRSTSKLASGKRHRLRLQLEQLESRHLLAGDIDLAPDLSPQSAVPPAPISWFESFDDVSRIEFESLAEVDPMYPDGFQGPRELAAGEWIVQLTESAARKIRVLQSADEILDDATNDFTIIAGLGSEGLILVRGEGVSAADIELNLGRNGSVQSFGLNSLITGQATAPNESDFAAGLLGGLTTIGAEAAWDESIGDMQTVIGVVDSGIDLDHPDLYLNIWLNQGEIPASFRDDLVDVDGDGLITFYDLNNLQVIDGTIYVASTVVLDGGGNLVSGDLATAAELTSATPYAIGANAAYVRDLAGDRSDVNGRIDALDLLADRKWSDGRDTDLNGFFDDFFGVNFRSGGGDPFAANQPDDQLSHGTHVAGTIGAVGNNAIGVVGVNWQTSMMSLRILDNNNRSDAGAGLRAVNYARMMRQRHSVDDDNRTVQGADVRVLNNSWGQPGGYEPAFETAINQLGDEGILFVAAAGNGDIFGNGINNDQTPFFPASYDSDNVIAVAAATPDGRLATFSNYGNHSVDIAAPGTGIRSTLKDGGYGTANGTSMAAPHVAGTAALIWSAFPQASLKEVRAAMLNEASVDPFTSENVLLSSGGRLNSAKATNADVFAPSARLISKQNITTTGGATTEFTVQYSHRDGIDLDSIGDDDIIVARQWGPQVDLPVTLKPGSKTVTPSGVQATYVMQAPGGGTFTNSSSVVIDDGPPNTVTSSIHIDDILDIPSAIAVSINVEHTYVGDLTITLIAPSGARAILVSHRGDASDHFIDTVFDDSAATSIANGSEPFTGTFKPEQSLTPLISSGILGTWTLEIEDAADADGGSLQDWTLDFTPRWDSLDYGDYLISTSADSVKAAATGVPIETRVIGAFNVRIDDDPSVIYVDSYSDSLESGSLRGAILAANAASPAERTIILDPGTYTIALPSTVDPASSFGASLDGLGIYNPGGWSDADSGDFDVAGHVTIIGDNNDETIIDAQGLDRVFKVHSGATLDLARLKVQAGISPAGQDGGGILSIGNLDLYQVTVSDNQAPGLSPTYGGGIAAWEGHVTLTESWLTENQADRGGALFVSGEASGFVERSTMDDNQGGGLYSLSSNDISVSNSTFSANAGGLGAIANGFYNLSDATDPVISGDGNIVVFESDADNLVPGDTNQLKDLFVYDRSTGITERITDNNHAGFDFGFGVLDDFFADVSDDGRYVSFSSEADNLISNDNNEFSDVYLFDRSTKLIERISVTASGGEADGESNYSSLSADGRFVAFSSNAEGLIRGEDNPFGGIYVLDRFTGTLELVSVSAAGEAGDSWSSKPSISADGRYVAFESAATNLVPADSNGVIDIFVYDRSTQTIERVNVDGAGVEANGKSELPDISDDGRFVTFESAATNLVAGDTNERDDIFVYDRLLDAMERVSVSETGEEAEYGARTPTISGDGRFVTFASSSSTLLPRDEFGVHIYVYDRSTSTVERVSVNDAAVDGNDWSDDPSISADGRFVTFQSKASNLAPGDSGTSTEDVFVFDRDTRTVTSVTYRPSPSKIDVIHSTIAYTSNSEVNHSVAGEVTISESLFAANQVISDFDACALPGAAQNVLSTTSESNRIAPLTRRGTLPPVHPLLADNPAVDSADSSADGSRDQLRQVRGHSDFGAVEAGTASVEGTVYFDRNRNGRFDLDEPGIDGISIHANGSTNLTTTSGESDQNLSPPLEAGGLSLSGLNPGTIDFIVQETTGWSVHTPPLALARSGSILGNADSTTSSTSNNGLYTAFVSDADNLVAGDTNSASDIFVFDRLNGTIERVSLNNSGAEGNASSTSPSISHDGRYVAFESDANNLVPADTNDTSDIFVYDRSTKTVERVSVDDSGLEGDSFSSNPSIAADGRYISFYSHADNLVSGDSNGVGDVFVYDRIDSEIERVSVSTTGAEGNARSGWPSLSADGRFVAYESTADNLVAGDTNGRDDIFVYDRLADEVQRVGVDNTGNEANDDSEHVSISGDGRFITFTSDASDLVPGDDNETSDIFVYDQATGLIERVEIGQRLGEGYTGSYHPALSADGRYIAFQSEVLEFDIDDASLDFSSRIYVYDRSDMVFELIYTSGTDLELFAEPYFLSLSPDARFVSFETADDILVPGNFNAFKNIAVAANPIAEPGLTRNLRAGDVLTGLDFGLVPDPGSISGRVFADDLISNEVYDPGEFLGVEATVFLDLNQNRQLDQDEPSTITGTDGRYEFPELEAYLSYTLAVISIAGYEQVAPSANEDFSWDIFLPPDGAITDRDFAFRPVEGSGQSSASSVSGRLFEDTNGNGLFDTGVDVPLANTPIYLDANNDRNHTAGADEPIVDTAADGTFMLDGLGSRIVSLRTELNGDFVQTTPLGNAFDQQSFDLFAGIVAFDTPSEATSADFNRDGFDDLAVLLSDGNLLAIRLNDQNGGFAASDINIPLGQTQALPGTSLPLEMVVGQFNHDAAGKLDVAVVGQSAGNVLILLDYDNHSQDFLTRRSVPVGTAPISLTSGDFDKNGSVDLAVLNFGTFTLAQASPPVYAKIDETFQLLLNDGTGTFAAQAAVTVPGDDPVSIVSDDFNNDGNLDLAVLHKSPTFPNSPFGDVTLFTGNGANVFAESHREPVEGGPLEMVSGDFNGDGLADLAVANVSQNTLSIVAGRADGTIIRETAHPIGTGEKGVDSMDVADIDNDGDLDIVATRLSDGGVAVFRNITDTTANPLVVKFEPLESFGVAQASIFERAPIVLANFDNDTSGPNGAGTIDIIAIPKSTATVNVLLNTLVDGGHRVALDGLNTISDLNFIVTPTGDVVPPVVKNVQVSGSGWMSSFKSAVDPVDLRGVSLPGADQLRALPWHNIDTIDVEFSEDVQNATGGMVDAADLTLNGVNVADYEAAAGFGITTSYSGGGGDGPYLLTINLAGAADFGPDRITLGIEDSIVDAAGNPLNGDWIDGVSTTSGDLAAGGNFVFHFNVLPGDVEGNGSVLALDVLMVNQGQFKFAGNVGYDPRRDIDASGGVLSNDVGLANNRQFTFLPPEPGAAATSQDVGAGASRLMSIDAEGESAAPGLKLFGEMETFTGPGTYQLDFYVEAVGEAVTIAGFNAPLLIDVPGITFSGLDSAFSPNAAFNLEFVTSLGTPTVFGVAGSTGPGLQLDAGQSEILFTIDLVVDPSVNLVSAADVVSIISDGPYAAALQFNNAALETIQNVSIESAAQIVGVAPPSVSLNSLAVDPADVPRGIQPTSWNTQRSQIRDIVIELQTPITGIPSGSITLTHLGVRDADPDTEVELRSEQVSLDTTGTVISILLDANQLADGRYQLDLSAEITSGSAFTLAGDDQNRFFVFRGDWDGNNSVDLRDLATLVYWYGETTGVPEYVDHDGSDGITIEDLAGLEANFGTQLDVPGMTDAVDPGLTDAEALQRAKATITNPSDVNGIDGVSPLDALNVINRLAIQVAAVTDWRFDVNRDGSISPRDALFVINLIATSTAGVQAAGESTEAATVVLDLVGQRQLFSGAGSYTFDFTITAIGGDQTITGFNLPLRFPVPEVTFGGTVADFTRNPAFSNHFVAPLSQANHFGVASSSGGDGLLLLEGQPEVLFSIDVDVSAALNVSSIIEVVTQVTEGVDAAALQFVGSGIQVIEPPNFVRGALLAPPGPRIELSGVVEEFTGPGMYAMEFLVEAVGGPVTITGFSAPLLIDVPGITFSGDQDAFHRNPSYDSEFVTALESPNAYGVAASAGVGPGLQLQTGERAVLFTIDLQVDATASIEAAAEVAKIITSGAIANSLQLADPGAEVIPDVVVASAAILAREIVPAVAINDGSAPRSQVTSLTVAFDALVDHDQLQMAFQLTNLSTGLVVGSVHVAAADQGNQTIATLTFDGVSTIARGGIGNSLADGNYRLEIFAGQVQSSNGQQLFRDQEFGDTPSDLFFRLFGDTDGDRDVDGQDYGRFGLSFLSSSGENDYNSDLDSDGDGDVDGQDYGRFGLNFLRRL